MAAACRSCGAVTSCFSDCPTLRWLDTGELRGQASNLPLPPFNPQAVFPLHQESPIGEEMAKIFAGITEGMIERHVAAVRAGLEEG